MTRPLIIIGAPRSGTNALRDALCSLPQFHTWPCDELNPLWRTGNTSEQSDELTARHARPDVIAKIEGAFERRSRMAPSAIVVEKTCANSLRPAFVHAAIPRASFLEITRDGRDAASSAAERWGAPFELGYTLRKLRFVPPGDLMMLSMRQVGHRLKKNQSPDRAKVTTWGPRFAGLTELINNNSSLEEICAAQWAACVTASSNFFDTKPPVPVLRIRYEDFVGAPVQTLNSICEFAGVSPTNSHVHEAGSTIHAGSVGRWTKTPIATSEPALRMLAAPLERLGYGND